MSLHHHEDSDCVDHFVYVLLSFYASLAGQDTSGNSAAGAPPPATSQGTDYISDEFLF